MAKKLYRMLAVLTALCILLAGECGTAARHDRNGDEGPAGAPGSGDLRGSLPGVRKGNMLRAVKKFTALFAGNIWYNEKKESHYIRST